ncbi:MAG: type II toxin-antitoxin system HicA family toxin [Kaiparowitsia implicata GSE-PSE-MK54-09C]|jgi:predicted RNA binding protein YcfA (HicA-like mRNA interferase family)|nr:type II toxin-antitoxin system HicA family toxin [Kaiparowitsia implicata GSE-PSE-MK54-09C]
MAKTSKIRDLKRDLRKSQFQEDTGKGSHTSWSHPLYAGKLIISGKDGDDAKPYQVKLVRQAIAEVQRRQI